MPGQPKGPNYRKGRTGGPGWNEVAKNGKVLVDFAQQVQQVADVDGELDDNYKEQVTILRQAAKAIVEKEEVKKDEARRSRPLPRVHAELANAMATASKKVDKATAIVEDIEGKQKELATKKAEAEKKRDEAKEEYGKIQQELAVLSQRLAEVPDATGANAGMAVLKAMGVNISGTIDAKVQAAVDSITQIVADIRLSTTSPMETEESKPANKRDLSPPPGGADHINGIETDECEKWFDQLQKAREANDSAEVERLEEHKPWKRAKVSRATPGVAPQG